MRRLLLPAMLGAISVLAFAPFAFYPLIWLSLGGLFVLLRGAARPLAGAAQGFAFGLAFFGAGTSWVYVSLSVFGGLPPLLAALATALFCAAMALYPALFGGLFVAVDARCRRGKTGSSGLALLYSALRFAALWTLVEWLRGWLFTGFPWLLAGYALAPASPLAGYAPLLGVHGLTLLGALVGSLLAAFLTTRRAPLLLLALLVLAGGLVLKTQRFTAPTGKALRVALLQGNVAQEMKWRPEKLAESLAVYEELLRANPAELTILPETAIPVFFDDLAPAYLARLQALAARQGGDLIVGAPLAAAGGGYANAALSLGASPSQVYRKTHLVPFGEFVPPGFRWFVDRLQIPLADFTPGPAAAPPLRVVGQSVAVNICYEDAFASEIAARAQTAGLLVNLSNTAWFGASLAQPQHLQMAQLRALENGRPMLRATNTGMTALIEPDGSIKAQLPAFTRAALVGEVQAYAGRTPYGYWRDAPVLAICCLIVALALLRSRRKKAGG